LSPITFKKGEARDALDLYPPFVLHVGNSEIQNVSSIVCTAAGDRWLSIEEREDSDAPIRLSADFFDEAGEPTLALEGNEWVCLGNQWDVETEGRRIIVRSGPRRIALQLEARPPHGLALERLSMRKGELSIDVQPSGTTVIRNHGGVTEFDSNVVANAECVFLL